MAECDDCAAAPDLWAGAGAPEEVVGKKFDGLTHEQKAAIDAKIFVKECHRRQSAAPSPHGLRRLTPECVSQRREHYAALYLDTVKATGQDHFVAYNVFVQEEKAIRLFGLKHRKTGKDIDFSDLADAMKIKSGASSKQAQYEPVSVSFVSFETLPAKLKAMVDVQILMDLDRDIQKRRSEGRLDDMPPVDVEQLRKTKTKEFGQRLQFQSINNAENLVGHCMQSGIDVINKIRGNRQQDTWALYEDIIEELDYLPVPKMQSWINRIGSTPTQDKSPIRI